MFDFLNQTHFRTLIIKITLRITKRFVDVNLIDRIIVFDKYIFAKRKRNIRQIEIVKKNVKFIKRLKKFVRSISFVLFIETILIF